MRSTLKWYVRFRTTTVDLIRMSDWGSWKRKEQDGVIESDEEDDVKSDEEGSIFDKLLGRTVDPGRI